VTGAFVSDLHFLDLVEVDRLVVVFFAAVLRVVEREVVALFLVAAPFFAAVERLAAFRLRVAAPFLAAAERVRDAVVVFLAAVERLPVLVDFLVVDRDDVERAAVDFFAAPPFFPPRFEGVVSFFLPRPEPLFLPPPSCAFTVA
jgi:hypothetical protein